jgi:hypothetical protein
MIAQLNKDLRQLAIVEKPSGWRKRQIKEKHE